MYVQRYMYVTESSLSLSTCTIHVHVHVRVTFEPTQKSDETTMYVFSAASYTSIDYSHNIYDLTLSTASGSRSDNSLHLKEVPRPSCDRWEE